MRRQGVVLRWTRSAHNILAKAPLATCKLQAAWITGSELPLVSDNCGSAQPLGLSLKRWPMPGWARL
eukprot:8853345-Alexandrium_andersonii.AAC.1